ncbi:hypothetical protein PVK06_020819 [Gossypium arboreum]|uniref:Uncharacterized protein n=1 Tax=Gossypium arboreum TaxID=29729 RepID=A0ABR0PND2_GOSAR|nr:hypothetical protein PVK06_020819 [Gossypium arboreum]
MTAKRIWLKKYPKRTRKNKKKPPTIRLEKHLPSIKKIKNRLGPHTSVTPGEK